MEILVSLLHFHFPTQKRPPEQHFALRVAFGLLMWRMFFAGVRNMEMYVVR